MRSVVHTAMIRLVRSVTPVFLAAALIGLWSCGGVPDQGKSDAAAGEPIKFTSITNVRRYCEKRQTEPLEIAAAETRMGPVRLSAQGTNIDASAQSIAYAVPERNGVRVVLNGRAEPIFENLERSLGVFDSTGSHFAYGAREAGQWLVVRDGKRGKGRFSSIGAKSLVFDPTGRHLAFSAARGAERLAVVDENEHSAYDDLSKIVFSSDGSHTAYIARKEHKEMIVIDGKPTTLNHRALLSAPIWMRGNQFAYVAEDGPTKWVVIPGGSEQRKFKAIVSDQEGNLSVRFSADGQHYGYFAQMNNGAFAAVIDGNIYGPFFRIGDAPLFSHDGYHHAYAAAHKPMAWVMVRDGAVTDGLNFQAIGSAVALSDDSSELAYAAKRENGKWVVVVNECESAQYDRIRGLAFLQSGVVAYLPDIGAKKSLIIGEQELTYEGELIYTNLAKLRNVPLVRAIVMPRTNGVQVVQHTYQVKSK
jgi:hypothetical protein